MLRSVLIARYYYMEKNITRNKITQNSMAQDIIAQNVKIMY